MLSTVIKYDRHVTFLMCLPFMAFAQVQDVQRDTTQAVSEITGFPPCDALISAGLGDRVLLATSDAYEPRVQSWWSANARLRPWCFLQPHTTQEVSLAIRTLADSGSGAGDWQIAVRSGGHGPPGSNNIANGVTIDLGMMNGSFYDPEREIASVEPGGHWKNVYYNLLHNGNVTVTGGRDGDVGVGGFLLGGGNSYYSGHNGFGCDTVMNFEVVLANGSVVNANSKENPRLWKALKGGSLNYGIVTRFDLQTMPAVDLAYGTSIISSNYSDEVVDAVVEFANHPEELASDALITLYTHDTRFSGGVASDVAILVIRANTRGSLNTTSFDKINAIPSLSSTWGHVSLADAANSSQVPSGTKNTQTTLTFLNSPDMLHKSVDLHSELVSSLSQKFGSENFLTQMFFQPLPSYFNTIGQRSGGNVLGLDRIPSNAILWTAGVGIKNGDDAAMEVARVALNAMTSKLKEYASTTGMAADLVYLNYADAFQDPLGSYGPENVAFLKDVAMEYDPQGWWQQRVPGGFKLSRVA